MRVGQRITAGPPQKADPTTAKTKQILRTKCVQRSIEPRATCAGNDNVRTYCEKLRLRVEGASDDALFLRAEKKNGVVFADVGKERDVVVGRIGLQADREGVVTGTIAAKRQRTTGLEADELLTRATFVDVSDASEVSSVQAQLSDEVFFIDDAAGASEAAPIDGVVPCQRGVA